MQALGHTLFLDAELADARRRLVELEAGLERLRVSNPRQPLSQADLLPYEVVRDRYRQLLVRSEETRSAEPISSAARSANSSGSWKGRVFPNVRSDRAVCAVNLAGALAGLGLGFVLVGRARPIDGSRLTPRTIRSSTRPR